MVVHVSGASVIVVKSVDVISDSIHMDGKFTEGSGIFR